MSLHFRAPAIVVPNLLESPEITIKVLDEGHKKDFRAPRALICAKSEYFEAAFLNEMKETQTRVLELAEDADVTHAMMKLFITWLHTGLVYADDVDGIPAIASDYGYIAAPGTKRPATGQTSASHIVKPLSTDKPIEAPEDEPAAKRSKGEDIPEMPDTETQGCESSNAAENSTAAPQDTPVRDPRDPITWSYRSLFEIYVFADRYDTVALRNQIINIIQYKLVELKHFPGRSESIEYAVENLRSECPLRRLLCGWFSTCIRAKSFTGRREAMIKFLTGCPSEFLAECMTSMMAFCDCRTCPSNHDCVLQGHDEDDGVELCKWHPCTFHEHGKEGKEARWACERLWEALDRVSDWRVGGHDNVERRVYN